MEDAARTSSDVDRPGDAGESDRRAAASLGSNEAFDWDRFDSGAYFDHNYRALRDDDREIIQVVRDFFAGAGIGPHAYGVDVGSGTNLYPALAMLPFCDRIDLREFSASNVEWLRREVAGFSTNWDEFWQVCAESPRYAEVTDPRAELARRATVEQANVFLLPAARWDIGTMFFVACSLSTDPAEFRRALHRFVAALKPGAPFALGFMAKSEGYFVGSDWFPAVAIDAATVRDCLASVAYDVRVHPIDIGDPLRDGYGGMLVATGRVGGTDN